MKICVVLAFTALLQIQSTFGGKDEFAQLSSGETHGQIHLDTYLPWLTGTLSAIESDPENWHACMEVDEVRTRIQSYIKLILLARVVCRGCEIDIVLQVHVDGTVDEQQIDVLSSQQQISDIFEQKQYELIGLENDSLDPWSLEEAFMRFEKAGVTHDRFMWNLYRQAPEHAWIMHLLEHPEQRMIGIEDDALLELEQAYVGPYAKEHGRFPVNDYTRAFTNVRSEIGLAKLLIKLHNLDLKRGAIVMGYLHEVSLQRSAEWFGVEARVIDTRPSWSRE